MGKLARFFLKNILIFLFILNVHLGLSMPLSETANIFTTDHSLQSSHDDLPQILILYGSPEDKITSSWLIQDFQLKVQFHPLIDIKSLISSSLDWNAIKTVWIINSNTTLLWDYYFGILFDNIVKHNLNLFLITPSVRWIDPFYWDFFGIEDVAWYSKYLINNSKLQALRMNVDDPEILFSLMDENRDLNDIKKYFPGEFVISGYSEWVKFELSGDYQKIISIAPHEKNDNIISINNWESGTIMKITNESVIFVTTFFPQFENLNSTNMTVMRNPDLKKKILSQYNQIKILQNIEDTPLDSLEVWNVLRIISSLTITFSITPQNDNLIPSFSTEQLTSILPTLAIGTVILIGLTYFLSKIGVLKLIKSLIKKILAIPASLILFIGSIIYKPFKKRISEEDVLDNETRQKIVEYLEKRGSSGAHLREIQAHVNKSISSVLWHLQTLEQFGLIDSKKIGKYKIFYLTRSKKSTEEVKSIKQLQLMEWSTLMKSNLAKKIITLMLNAKQPMKLTEISKKLKCHHETARYHLLRMLDMGMISCTGEPNSKKSTRYFLTPTQRDHLAQLIFDDK